jgi:hypothetical protein
MTLTCFSIGPTWRLHTLQNVKREVLLETGQFADTEDRGRGVEVDGKGADSSSAHSWGTGDLIVSSAKRKRKRAVLTNIAAPDDSKHGNSTAKRSSNAHTSGRSDTSSSSGRNDGSGDAVGKAANLSKKKGDVT